jgi:5,10-methylenetetrahydromethanopterin reductase
MRIGTMIGEVSAHGSGLDAILAQVQRAERDGLHSAWFPHIFGVDALTVAALAGRVTSRIELGTAVVPTFSRHPIAMAQQALTAQAAAAGRFALGIGLSHQIVIETMFGLSFAKPFTHMREYMAVLAPLIRSGACAFAGKEFRVHANVQVVGASPCPILLAALAPKMLTLAGSEGDGTITWMTGPRTLREYTIPRLQEAAARAGRPAPRIVAGLPIAVTDDVKGARERAASSLQVYGALPSYRAMLDREQVEGPADLAVVGDEATVGEHLQQLSQLGVTDLLAAPFPTGKDGAASLDRTYRFLASLATRVGG